MEEVAVLMRERDGFAAQLAESTAAFQQQILQHRKRGEGGRKGLKEGAKEWRREGAREWLKEGREVNDS